MAKISTVIYGDLNLLPKPAMVPLKKTYEFLTAVATAKDGTEERQQLRSKARQSIDCTIPISLEEFAQSFNTVYGGLRKKQAIPLWAECQNVIVAPGTIISCNTVLYDLRPNSLAMLWRSVNEYSVIEIDSITDTDITLSEATTLSGNWFLLPVRVGTVSGNPINETNGNSSFLKIKYDIEDNLFLEVDAPAQYLSKDIYFFLPLLNANSIENVFSRYEEITDFDLGPIAKRSLFKYTNYSKPLIFKLEGIEEIKDFEKFIYRRCGKFNTFWYPLFEHNLRVKNSSTITNILQIESDSFIDFSLQRQHIALNINGTWQAVSVLSATQSTADTVSLTLSTTLNCKLKDIQVACYLGLNRLDNDRISLNFKNNLTAESTLQIIEIAP